MIRWTMTTLRPARPVGYRGASSDPTFGYLIALALAVGLTALPPEQRDLRYTIIWLVPGSLRRSGLAVG